MHSRTWSILNCVPSSHRVFFGLDALTLVIHKLSTKVTEMKVDQDVLKAIGTQTTQRARTETFGACRICPKNPSTKCMTASSQEGKICILPNKAAQAICRCEYTVRRFLWPIGYDFCCVALRSYFAFIGRQGGRWLAFNPPTAHNR